MKLLQVNETLTPADHQTHRRYAFAVPANCTRLTLHARYAPKYLDAPASAELARTARIQQTNALAALVGPAEAHAWANEQTHRVETVRISNLLTISLDDALGTYRGAAHRQSPDQHLFIAPDAASPGLTPGSLRAGQWTLVLSAHTLVSAHCDVSIQIGADSPTSTP